MINTRCLTLSEGLVDGFGALLEGSPHALRKPLNFGKVVICLIFYPIGLCEMTLRPLHYVTVS